MDIVVTYDISVTSASGPRRLRQVAAVCERFGERVQNSVFECRLDDIHRQQLIIELTDLIDPDSDSVRMYRLDRPFSTATTALGTERHDWDQPDIL